MALSQVRYIPGFLYLGYSQRFPKNMTGLHFASTIGLYTLLEKLLLEKGAEGDPKDSDDRTPLSWAAESGHKAVVKLLLEKGAEVDFQDRYGHAPLLVAAIAGCYITTQSY